MKYSKRERKQLPRQYKIVYDRGTKLYASIMAKIKKEEADAKQNLQLLQNEDNGSMRISSASSNLRSDDDRS